MTLPVYKVKSLAILLMEMLPSPSGMINLARLSFSWILCLAASLMPGGMTALGQAAAPAKAPPFKTLIYGGASKKSIPSSFVLGTDRFGLKWECRSAGILTSGSTNVKALELHANDQAFVPQQVSVTGPGHLQISGKTAEGIEIMRDLLLDTEVGAVREYTEITNPGEQAASLSLEWRVTYEVSGFQALLNGKGKSLLLDEPLPKEEENIAVVEAQQSGNQPSVFIYEGNKGASQQPIHKGTGKGKLAITYALELAPKQKKTFLRWAALRFGAEEASRDFVKQAAKNGRPLSPEVPPESLGLLVNMAMKADSGTVGGDQGDQSARLIALNRLAKSSGVERGTEDMVWMGANSILIGEMAAGTVRVQTRAGESKSPLAEVAAIQGGAGRGQVPRVYLRDGSVLAGPGKIEGGPFKTRDGWSLDLDLLKMDRLFLKLGASDGHAPPGTKAFFHLADGQMIPAASVAGGHLPLVTPWGELSVAPEEIAQWWSVREPVPVSLIKLKNGSLFQALPGAAELKIESARGGAFLVHGGEVVGLSGADSAQEEDIPDVEEAFNKAAVPLFYLKGQNLFAGAFAEPELKMNLAGNTASIQSADIEKLMPGSFGDKEDGKDEVQKSGSFTIKLRSGQTLQGMPVSPVFLLKIGQATWPVPAEHLWGYSNTKPSSDEKPAEPKAEATETKETENTEN